MRTYVLPFAFLSEGYLICLRGTTLFQCRDMHPIDSDDERQGVAYNIIVERNFDNDNVSMKTVHTNTYYIVQGVIFHFSFNTLIYLHRWLGLRRSDVGLHWLTLPWIPTGGLTLTCDLRSSVIPSFQAHIHLGSEVSRPLQVSEILDHSGESGKEADI